MRVLECFGLFISLFRCVLASLYEVVSVRLSVCLSVYGPCVTCFFFKRPIMNQFLYENHWDSPTLTLLNVLGVLGVPNALNVLHVLHVLNMPMDASLACWALLSL